MGFVEKITVNGKTVVLERASKPVDVGRVDTAGLRLDVVNVFDSSLVPTNYDQAEGTPRTLFAAEGLKVDLSKRTKQAMSFWHRNCDFDELIFCVKGAIDWETELGPVHLNAGEMFVIPRGIAHRSSPGQTETENVVLELKVHHPLRRIGE